MSQQSASADAGSPDSSSEGGNFLQRIIAAIFGGGDPEREKKRLLKQIGKNITKNRYKFFKPKSNEALAGLARFFYEIYRVVGPAQNLLQNAEESAALREIVIDEDLSDEERALRQEIAPDVIRELATNRQAKELAEAVKQRIAKYYSVFNAEKLKSVNETFRRLQIFLRFVHFDYFFVVRKFDSAVTENNFTYKPRFDSISGDYIGDDIKDFLEVMLLVDKNTDWDKVINVLNVYKGIDVVNRNAWAKLLGGLDSVRSSGILPLIIQYVDKDPYYKPTVPSIGERIVEPYLNQLKTQTEITVQKIVHERRDSKIDKLLKQVFGTTAISRTKNYTEKANLMFSKRMMGGYTLTAPINYLKAFLLDYYKKDVREVVRDLLLVRGQWATNMDSQKLSDAFHEVLDVGERLVAFDESLADDGERGQKLRRVMGRVVDKDAATVRALRDVVGRINDEAQKLINQAGHGLIGVGKHLKNLIEDFDKKEHDYLMNWKELDAAYEGQLKAKLTELYKTIYFFVQLLQMFVKNK